MKAVFICALLFVAAVHCQAQTAADCDPDGNGQPDCSSSADGNYHNYWDPTRFWVCTNGEVTSQSCPAENLYDPSTKQCISYTEWQWVEPCASS